MLTIKTILKNSFEKIFESGDFFILTNNLFILFGSKIGNNFQLFNCQGGL